MAFPYGSNRFLIGAQVISVVSLILGAVSIKWAWSFWIFGLFSTMLLLSMLFMILDITSIRTAAALSALCALAQFIAPPLAHELSTKRRVAGILSGVGWLIAAGLTYYFTTTLDETEEHDPKANRHHQDDPQNYGDNSHNNHNTTAYNDSKNYGENTLAAPYNDPSNIQHHHHDPQTFEDTMTFGDTKETQLSPLEDHHRASSSPPPPKQTSLLAEREELV